MMMCEPHIRSCERCMRFKQKPEQEQMSSFETSYPMEIVHMDFLLIGLKRDPNKEINVLVVTDHLTCYAQAFVTTSQTAPCGCSNIVTKNISCIMGGLKNFIVIKPATLKAK